MPTYTHPSAGQTDAFYSKDSSARHPGLSMRPKRTGARPSGNYPSYPSAPIPPIRRPTLMRAR